MNNKIHQTIKEINENELIRLELKNKIDEYEAELLDCKRSLLNSKEKEKILSGKIFLYERKLKSIDSKITEKKSLLNEKVKKVKMLIYKKMLSAGFEQSEINKFEIEFSELAETINSLTEIYSKKSESSKKDKSLNKPENNKFNMKDLRVIEKTDEISALQNELRLGILSSNIKKKSSKKATKDKDTSKNKVNKIANKVNDKKKDLIDNALEDFDDYYDENLAVKEKFNKMFYEKPNQSKKNTVSSKYKNDGLFDFEDALNPTMSLMDIMNDINKIKNKK